MLAGAIFVVIAILQLVRALSGWQITVNGAAFPMWPSWVAFVAAAALAWLGLRACRRG
jgi:hypothetical protein